MLLSSIFPLPTRKEVGIAFSHMEEVIVLESYFVCTCGFKYVRPTAWSSRLTSLLHCGLLSIFIIIVPKLYHESQLHVPTVCWTR